MNTSKLLNRVIIVSLGAVLFSSSLFAQRGEHFGRRGYGHFYNYGYPLVSLGLGIASYGYYPYSSYYGPGYYPAAPYIGLRFRALPFGFSTIYVGTNPFYYYEGIYYRPYGNNEYEVAAPPLGARVPELPKNAKVTVINGEKYYVYDGTYYKEDINDKNEIWYTVVGTNGQINTGNTTLQNNQPNNQVGDRLESLPADSKPVVINKQKYFLAPSGVYYQEVVDGNKVYYEVIGDSSGMK